MIIHLLTVHRLANFGYMFSANLIVLLLYLLGFLQLFFGVVETSHKALVARYITYEFGVTEDAPRVS